jgi:demethylmenaquinone methyltransferase/2-methoxy-6-polyprenyl-1,4-benzoquinol methylase
VHAVDLSARMIEMARRKIIDERVTWHTADVQHFSLGDGSCDRIFCCSVWPHFDNRQAVAAELFRLLRPCGRLHIWHLISRARINAIHATAGEAVRHDHLPTAEQTAKVLSSVGFRLITLEDNEHRYLVTASKAVP